MVSLNVDLARGNMLVNQIRAWDVLDARVLRVLAEVPREQFVPSRLRHLAFADEMIPIGHGQTMFAPKYEGRFLQALNPGPDDSVLEIGTGTGYMAALLAACARRVTTVEIFQDLAEEAEQRLQARGFRNVVSACGDGASGWPADAPYDVILVTGSLPRLPEALVAQLKPGGRLGVILGESPAMAAQVIGVDDAGNQRVETLFETDLPALINAPRPDSFRF